MSNSAEVATAGEGNSPSTSLTEAQLSAFWDGIVSNLAAARRMAAQFVRRQSVDDVVNSAALRFLDSLQNPEKPAPIPATEEHFRGEFLAIVRNYAIDCIRDRRVAKRPIHSHWAKAPEPAVRGSNVADRELDRVFARNDNNEYDAPAPIERREKDDLDELNRILRAHLADLSPTQREIIDETFFMKRKRAVVAARRGISPSTYDNHLQAAFRALRESMTDVVDVSTDVDRSVWYDRIEELRERHAVKRLRRVSAKKGKRSTSGGERSNLEGERSNLGGERSNSAHERGENSQAGAA